MDPTGNQQKLNISQRSHCARLYLAPPGTPNLRRLYCANLDALKSHGQRCRICIDEHRYDTALILNYFLFEAPMKNRKLFCIWCAIVALSILAAATRGEEKPSSRPNILFVFTDDQAPWAVGASGNEQIKTPNMDRLFREGAYLRNTFTVTPVCSPSRASLMTSRYGSELGITDWIKPGAEGELGLDPETITWPELLQLSVRRSGRRRNARPRHTLHLDSTRPQGP